MLRGNKGAWLHPPTGEALTELTALIKMMSKPIRTRPSNYQLRKELNDPKTPRQRKNRIYGWLQYRRRHTHGR